MRLRWLAMLMIGLGASLMVGVIILFFLSRNNQEGPILFNWSGTSNGLRVGEKAPDFTLLDIEQNSVQLSNFHGKFVILNFWATWCPPCIEEMPLLQKTSVEFSDQVIVLAVNDGERREIVEKFVYENQITFTVLLDPQEDVNMLYRIQGYPTTYFVDPEGKIRYTQVGVMEESQLNSYLNKLGLMDD